MRTVPYPTTLIVLSVVFGTVALGLQGTIDGAAVTSTFGAIISGVLVGHYVKTSNTANVQNGATTTTTGEDATVTTASSPATKPPAEGESL